MTDDVAKEDSSPAGDWVELGSEELPRPTYAPAAMALGVTLLAWGLVTSWVVVAAGSVLIVASLVGWIGEMRHD